MRVLVACEHSGRVARAFRANGHEAWSCDLQPTMAAVPFHLQTDVRNVLSWGWDAMIAFPPCRYLTNANNQNPHLMRTKEFQAAREEARDFFLMLARYPSIPHIAVENPVGYINGSWRQADQVFDPCDFGHPYKKRTCLWMENLPLLKATKRVEPTGGGWASSSARSPMKRALTFSGVAQAMGQQWGDYLWDSADRRAVYDER